MTTIAVTFPTKTKTVFTCSSTVSETRIIITKITLLQIHQRVRISALSGRSTRSHYYCSVKLDKSSGPLDALLPDALDSNLGNSNARVVPTKKIL